MGGQTYSYEYDKQNQLTKAVYPDGTTYSYEYDTVGNIRKKTDGGTTHNYAYNDAAWADLLTSYDGHNIAYEGQTYANGEVTGNPTSGNPTRYYNGKTWNMEWENGRELSRITRGSKTWDFTYDMAGVRSGKTVTTRDASTGEITGTTEYKYTTLSGKLVRVEYNTTILDIVYDESGQPFSIRYKSSPTATGALYYYVLNAQGDVVGLLNSSGELVVEYKYDPWGKLLETIIGVDETDSKYAAYNNMGLRNPLRYRGYIYDRDTGLYYLQSRYYDPAIGRFINADTYTTTDETGLLSTNMFAYCENNPISRFDPTGELFWDVLDWAMAAMSWEEFLNSPSWSGAGWALLDTLALVPGAPSLSYARRGADVVDTLSHGRQLISGTHKLKYAEKYGIDAYYNLRNSLAGSGLEAHHIIERRFKDVLNANPNYMLSVAVTREEHQKFTKAWRNAFAYGTDYSKVTKAELWMAAKEIYKDYPELLEAARRTIYH